MIKHKILIAEDQRKLADVLCEEFTKRGYEVVVANDGNAAEAIFVQHKFSIVLLDINLPYKNGYELCKIFRAMDNKVPIIMLTALGELDDKMGAFDAGADDYIVKPFHMQELLARVQVFLKRRGSNAIVENEKLVDGDLVIDFDNKSVHRNGIEISLTSREFSLLEVLARNKGRVVSKAQLSEQVWGINFDTGTNTIEVFISFLRNKIDKPFSSKLIHTKPGFGYFFGEQ
jgi:two-component system copper resistance phosphate regulon response regulator CusR